MNRLASAFVLGYHGCDKQRAAEFLLNNKMEPSRNKYDWLGTGIYFWEANPLRGLQWAQEQSRRPKATIKTPYVIGAVIDLGLCLDLTTSGAIKWVRVAHQTLLTTSRVAGTPLPKNSEDALRRNLDCAVINMLHEIRQDDGQQPIQTVRGIFVEGQPIYAGSGFYEKTHVQIAVRDHSCIKGLFRVPDEHLLT